jgi:hypothetical protein
LEAKGLTHDENEEISKRKKMGKTTTDENLQAEKHYWQKFFLAQELDGKTLNNFIYGVNPFYKNLGLIDTSNHKAEDNPATSHMFIINPLSGQGADNLFSTHPATANRVAALMKMGGGPVESRRAERRGTAVPTTR